MSHDGRDVVELQEAWLRYHRAYSLDSPTEDDDRDWWAVNELMELPEQGEMERMWDAITGRCRQLRWDSEPRIISVLAAGPLEDFVVKFGPEAMDLIESSTRRGRHSAQSAGLRLALGGIRCEGASIERCKRVDRSCCSPRC